MSAAAGRIARHPSQPELGAVVAHPTSKLIAAASGTQRFNIFIDLVPCAQHVEGVSILTRLLSLAAGAVHAEKHPGREGDGG